MRAAVLALVAACARATAPAPAAVSNTSDVAPRPAGCGDKCMPGVAFVDAKGMQHDRGTLYGQVVVINFFATWAKPSRNEAPMLALLARRYIGKVTFIGVLTSDDQGDVDGWIRSHGVTYPVVRATPAILEAYEHPAAMPTTYIYDRSGAFVDRAVGSYREDKLIEMLDKLVAR